MTVHDNTLYTVHLFCNPIIGDTKNYNIPHHMSGASFSHLALLQRHGNHIMTNGFGDPLYFPLLPARRSFHSTCEISQLLPGGLAQTLGQTFPCQDGLFIVINFGDPLTSSLASSSGQFQFVQLFVL